MTTAIRLAGATPLGRVRYAHPADVGRALDLGCAGVIIPNVESAEQARAIAGACRYPPDGYRSAGGVLATGAVPLCLVMVESRAAPGSRPPPSCARNSSTSGPPARRRASRWACMPRTA